MNTYRLTPINPTDPCWKYSETTEAVVVVAEDEKTARSKACSEYEVQAESCLGENNPSCPWDNPEKSMCECLGAVSS